MNQFRENDINDYLDDFLNMSDEEKEIINNTVDDTLILNEGHQDEK